MSQQLSDVLLVASGVVGMGVFGVAESALRGWFRRRRDYRIATAGLRRRMR